MTANHALFRYLFKTCLDINERTFDYLPEPNTEYPFIYIGESSSVDSEALEHYGEIEQTIHIYGLRTDRAEIDNITNELLAIVRNVHEAHGFQINYKTCRQQNSIDNTDIQPLIHRVLDMSFFYNEKGL